MNPLVILLGSKTRASILEALAFAKKPLTSYRISIMYNMNVAKVYKEMEKLARLGVARASKGRRGVEYVLADEDLSRIVSRFSSNVISFEEWSGSTSRTKRFRPALTLIPKFDLKRRSIEPLEQKPSRMAGELENLAGFARKRFAIKYRRIGDHKYALI